MEPEVIGNTKIGVHGKIHSVVYSPLAKSAVTVRNLEWYDEELLRSVTKPRLFDMVIVDGPPAWEAQKKLARFPALPFITNQLKAEYSIFLDDANREGEKLIIEKWEALLNAKFSYSGNSLAYTRVGGYYTEPCAY